MHLPRPLPGWFKWFLLPVLAAFVLEIGVVAAFLGLAIGVGAADWQVDAFDWAAVAALVSLATLAVTTVAAGAIAFTAIEFRRATERDRVERKPYLRVDIAFADNHEPGFAPPDARYVYTAAELGIDDELAELNTLLDPNATSGANQLTLWVENLQTQPLGLARAVEVQLRVVWLQADDEEHGADVTIVFAYVQPRSVTATRLGVLSTDVVSLVCRVEGVRYRDLVDELISDATHGALVLAYNENEGVRNERHAFVFEP